MKKLPKNIQRIQNWLQKIEWRVIHVGCDHYAIIDHNGIESDWIIYGDMDTRIYYDKVDFKGDCCFYLRDLKFQALKHHDVIDCISIKPKYSPKNPGIFLQFYNHDRKRKS